MIVMFYFILVWTQCDVSISLMLIIVNHVLDLVWSSKKVRNWENARLR